MLLPQSILLRVFGVKKLEGLISPPEIYRSILRFDGQKNKICTICKLAHGPAQRNQFEVLLGPLCQAFDRCNAGRMVATGSCLCGATLSSTLWPIGAGQSNCILFLVPLCCSWTELQPLLPSSNSTMWT